MAPEHHSMTGVALVTGAASGIGRACAATFVKEGCTRLILVDLGDKLEEVDRELKALNSKVETALVTADISREEEVHRMIKEGVGKFGAVHYAVNCAGIATKPRGRTHELAIETWDKVNTINYRGLWLCERAEILQMLQQPADLKMRTGAPAQRGAIVNIASILATMAMAKNGSYGPGKMAVVGLTRTDAVAYAADGIRANTVSPGMTRTPMVEGSLRAGADYADKIASVPMMRWALPEEIAEACVFLCSEKASMITGIDVRVDGGYCISG